MGNLLDEIVHFHLATDATATKTHTWKKNPQNHKPNHKPACLVPGPDLVKFILKSISHKSLTIVLRMTSCLSLPTRSLPSQAILGFCDSSLYKVLILSSGCFVRLSFTFILQSSSMQLACNDLKTISVDTVDTSTLKGLKQTLQKSRDSRTSFSCFRNKLSVQSQNVLQH